MGNDVSAFGSTVDPLLETYSENSNVMFITQQDGAITREFKLIPAMSYTGMIKPEKFTGVGAKGLEGSDTNPFGRDLKLARETKMEDIQKATRQAVDNVGVAHQPGDDKNLLKYSELIYHRVICVVEVMGEGTIPNNVAGYDFSVKKNAGEGIPADIVINPLIQGGTPPNNVCITIPAGATWDYMKQSDLRNFATWGLTFKYWIPGSDPFTDHLITPSALWDNFIAQAFSSALTGYTLVRIAVFNDYWQEQLTMDEFRSDDDNA